MLAEPLCNPTVEEKRGLRQLRPPEHPISFELAEIVTLGALHAQAIWRHPRTPPVDIGVYED